MDLNYRRIGTVALTGIWVSASEFLRNEVFLKKYWVDHYQSMGMIFPSEPLNGILWIVWSFLYAAAIYVISGKFDLIQTTFISWFMAFVMMWIVAWNLHVLPLALLLYAFPLSLLEAFIGAYICRKMSLNG
jgi:ABC-type multidrug transport system fused ATPase/permease subunit